LDSSSVDTASAVIGWLDQSFAMPTVQSFSGIFVGSVNVGDTATFASPWSFNSGPIAAFWTVDGYTFNLVASHIVFQEGGFVGVYGTGFLTGPGVSLAHANWSFTTQDDPANGVFSFSGSSQIPDGGATVGLLGLALAGIEGIRRKLKRVKS